MEGREPDNNGRKGICIIYWPLKKKVRFRGCCEYSPWAQNLITTYKVLPRRNKSLCRHRCDIYNRDHVCNKCNHMLRSTNTFYFQQFHPPFRSPPRQHYPFFIAHACLWSSTKNLPRFFYFINAKPMFQLSGVLFRCWQFTCCCCSDPVCGVSNPCCWGNTVVALYIVNRAKFHSETNYS